MDRANWSLNYTVSDADAINVHGRSHCNERVSVVTTKMASTMTLTEEIAIHLASKHIPANQEWLDNFVTGSRSTVPLQAQKQTALFRILASDFRQSLQRRPGSVFPANLADPNIKERKLSGPIPVQLLDIDDIGKSRWSQVEEIEAAEKGETTKGREIIRVLPNDEGSNVQDEQPKSAGPHRLTLQDAEGSTLYGIELHDIPGIDLSLNIGAKMVLQNITVARGVALLDPSCVQVLGGKIEALHKTWKEERKQRLKTLAGAPPDAT